MHQPPKSHDTNKDASTIFPDLRKYAAPLKEYLRRHGHEWKFYDSLDSYAGEYEQVKKWAIETVASLAHIHECSVREFYGPAETVHEKLRIDRWELLYFTPVDVGEEYGVGAGPKPGTAAARTEAFRDEHGELKTVILITRKAAGATSSEISAGLKLPPLLHEVGHAIDWQEGTNLHEGEVSIVDAEIQAHRFALRECLDRQYFISLQCYVDGLAKLAEIGTYEVDVWHALDESGIFEECRKAQETAWWKIVRNLTPTADDLKMMESLAESAK